MKILQIFTANCYLAFGRYLNIPMVGIVTSAPLDWHYDAVGASFNTAVMPGIISAYSSPMNFWERLGNTLEHYSGLAQYYYYIRQQDEKIEKYFGPGYPRASEILKDLDLFLVNAHYSIDGIKSITPSMIPVGGLHIVDDGTKLPSVIIFNLILHYFFTLRININRQKFLTKLEIRKVVG